MSLFESILLGKGWELMRFQNEIDPPDVPPERNYYAHSLEGLPPIRWELLEEHLQDVAKLAEQFAAKFNAGAWGRQLGLWHDIGKYSEEFQDYLLTQNGYEAHLETRRDRVDHSSAGAQLACKYNQQGREQFFILAYCLAGHHAGLADACDGKSSLECRLEKCIPRISAAPEHLLQPVAEFGLPPLSLEGPADHIAFQVSLFTRMLFSCLVDADRSATEAFADPTKSVLRNSTNVSFARIKKELDQYLSQLTQRPVKDPRGMKVKTCRQEVLAACRQAANCSPGLFSLSVPTGGGKTLASLAFALNHVTKHDLSRIIYAIPFTSIIEQTADVFRKVFEKLPDELICEHHSQIDPEVETLKSRLVIENWDAPLVVTTNVQLFESLFASGTSRCRKLHNIAGSVIILDEVQVLPVGLLRPIIAVLRELATNYGCTIVLCTATQPALTFREDFPIGLENVREIIPDAERLDQRMKRVDVHNLGKLTDQQLVERLLDTPSFLTILNTRPHASRVYRAIHDAHPVEGLFHLSTNLCGEHRTEIIKIIRQRLAQGLPCQVVSTQLVEAGVDLDFPVVYRAMTGLDSLAQAAGRCNREGQLESGSVYLFAPFDCPLRGYLKAVAATAEEVIPDFDDLLDPAAIQQYFELHYWNCSGDDRWDDNRVMECFPKPPDRFEYYFRKAAERFRMIDDVARTIFVPYGEGRQLIKQLRNQLQKGKPERKLLRKLQRYTVGVYEQHYAQMVGSDVEELEEGTYAVLLNDNIYDQQLGLRVERLGLHEPNFLIG